MVKLYSVIKTCAWSRRKKIVLLSDHFKDILQIFTLFNSMKRILEAFGMLIKGCKDIVRNLLRTNIYG